MLSPELTTEELLWGQFYSKIHELAERIRAKKRAESMAAYQAKTTDPATHQVTEATQPGECTLPIISGQTGG